MAELSPLTQCTECKVIFLEPPSSEIWRQMYSCPLCAADWEAFDEVPAYFEIATFWEIIEISFSLKERQILKLLGSKLPDA